MATQIMEADRVFARQLFPRLDKFGPRARALYRLYRRSYSQEMIDVLNHAIEKERVKAVLEVMQDHARQYFWYLRIKDPNMIRDGSGDNATDAMFDNIRREILGVESNAV